MAHFPKPVEGSWTEHFPQLDTAPVNYEDSISPEYYELEKEAIFKKTWLNVGRVEQIPRVGSYFTKELDCVDTSIIVVRDRGTVRAFHNMCRHRGNKLVWQDYPSEEVKGTCRQFTCKYHGWRYGLDGELNFVQQESEFFDLDKADYPLVSVHCEIWEGFIFVNFAAEPVEMLLEFLGEVATGLSGYPVWRDDSDLRLQSSRSSQLEALQRRILGVLPRPGPAPEPVGGIGIGEAPTVRLRGAALRPVRRQRPRHRLHMGWHCRRQRTWKW